MASRITRSTAEKVAIFRGRFTGLKDVYGTYDPGSGRARQVKERVGYEVLLRHLQGKSPYGVYLLDGDRTRAVVADFDDDDIGAPTDLVTACHGYGITAYVERSKSKGYHVWVFFSGHGVRASKARLIVRHVLGEIGYRDTEIFPKHNSLNPNVSYGSFINAPLFGPLVPDGRTVFLDLNDAARPFSNQWDFLDSVELVSEDLLDEIITMNGLDENGVRDTSAPDPAPGYKESSSGLLPCAQRMLAEGVAENQRVACFRLAVQLKKAGLPQDVAVAALTAWSPRNTPKNGKRIITEGEITEQVDSAYAKEYRGCGCDDPTVATYCSEDCPLCKRKHSPTPLGDGNDRRSTVEQAQAERGQQ